MAVLKSSPKYKPLNMHFVLHDEFILNRIPSSKRKRIWTDSSGVTRSLVYFEGGVIIYSWTPKAFCNGPSDWWKLKVKDVTSQLEFVEVGQGVLSKSRVVISCSISFVSYVCGRVCCFEEGLCLFECFLFLCVCIVLAVLARRGPPQPYSEHHPSGWCSD